MTSRRIAPPYSFRFTTADIRRTYGSAEGAFAHGDFLNAAQMAAPGSELKGCSLILGGLLEQGLAILNDLPSPGSRARLCRAFALWSLHGPAEAVAALDGVDAAPAAEKFRALLARDNINIFITGAILSVFPEHHSESFIAPSYKYGSITAKYVGSQLKDNAYDYDPTQPFDEFIDRLPDQEKPDILFSLSPQWLLAKSFHKVKTPKVIWCHDSDAFQYRNVDNYALYDAAICNCSQEHFELSQGTQSLYCAANMLLHPLATPFPEASPHSEKMLDVIFTGSAIAPFHSEKPRFLFQIAEIAKKYSLRIVEGHLPEQQYFALISRAKFLPIVNRYAGSPSPRWRDALANGAFLLYPEGTFYGEIAPGCFTYRAETLVRDVERHLRNFAEGRDSTYDLSRVVPEINRRFAIHRQPREVSYQRLLKYALFIGLVWPRETPAPKEPRQRRLCWLTPAVDCGLFGPAHVRDQLAHIAGHIDEGDLSDAIDYNNAAHLHAQLVFTFYESSNADAWAAEADRYFAEGLARYPNSLLLRFNEAHWSFFRPKADAHAAAAKFQACIDRFNDLTFDVHGADVAFAYTLHERDEVFPCYEYADVATSEMVLRHTPQLRGVKHVPHSARQLILSACYGFLGWALLKSGDRIGALRHLQRAMAIYPHGLPVARLYFETLLRRALSSKGLSRSEATVLADAFIDVVNINPSALLTHTLAVAPLVAEAGEAAKASEILAAWYRLANVVHSLRSEDEERALARLAILHRVRPLLPADLQQRIKLGLNNPEAATDLTQLERRLVQAWRILESEHGSRRRARDKYRDSLTQVLLEIGYYPDRVIFSNIKHGFASWWRAPTDVKVIYVKKTCQLLAQGDLKQALLRIQQWSSTSKWAQGAALNSRPRKRGDRFERLRKLWRKFKRA